MNEKSAEKAWGGVFRVPTDQRVESFSESISFDRRLANDDIDGSIAHSQMLAECGLLTQSEADAIRVGLEDIRKDISEGIFQFTASKEDIHLHIESALTEKLGDIGRKLHTARSRNDQVATDLRLFCRRAIDRIDGGLL
ncbi:MAG: argininosuccinate lyase, partial [Planctomycetaceae bacterium]|nr:argininosuccinate lyase [Planctomycetaceae bacterium]